MRSKDELLRVLKEFFNVDNIMNIEELAGGHINQTYLISFPECKYILQGLNHDVFTSPFGVMNNIELVTEHIKKRCIYEGRNLTRSVLNFVRTRYDQILAIVGGEYWRCMQYVEGGKTYLTIENEKMFQDAAKSVTPCGRLYLQVGNACDEFSAGLA